MKLMNFRSLDAEHRGKGLKAVGKGDRLVWNDFSSDRKALREIASEISRDAHVIRIPDAPPPPAEETPYWVFVCNPKKWSIDQFLERGIEHDTWGVRPSDKSRFAPGQLGLVRVGVDQRNKAERKGKPKLIAGVYALCEVESAAFPGTGANDEFWAPKSGRAPGWPTVKVRYLRTYKSSPLSITKLRSAQPNISPLLLDGFQAASFPISAQDFHAVIELLGEDPDSLPAPLDEPAMTADMIAELEKGYRNASPEVKERVSKRIERGPIGALVKQANGFRCQLCQALGINPIGFKKKSGEPYVEAHHAMPVAKKELGSLSASNVMTLCPNHHRQVHYGHVEITIGETVFQIVIDGKSVQIPRYCQVSEKDGPAKALPALILGDR